MKAVILAAGLGTRMKPFTDTTPKILAPFNGEPLLAHQLRTLAENGFTEVAINTHHLAEQVNAYVEGCAWMVGVEETMTIRLFHEPLLMGTAGGLLQMEEFLDEPFLVLYGDILVSFSLANLALSHEGLATIACYAQASEHGLVACAPEEEGGQIVSFMEKPVLNTAAGAYMLDPRALDYIVPGYDFGLNVFPLMLDRGETIRPYKIRADKITHISRVTW